MRRTDGGAASGHTYTGSGPYTARLGGCCTISTLQNNRDGNYETETLVDFARDDESPKSTVPPIVSVPSGGVQQWSVPAIDSGGETLRWRLATSAEACNGCSQPQPPGLTINASNGLVRWDTTGRPTGLYFTSVIIEALDSSGQVVSRSQVTYLIRVSATSNQPPVWQGSTPPAGTRYDCVQPGKELTIPLEAGDPNATNQVQILQFGLPAGATLDRTTGNPATATFRWTPTASQIGDHLLTFGAQDSALPPGSVFRSFIVQVKVCDTTPPEISVTTPADGGKYGRGETVNADYECTDEAGGSGLESCVGDKAKGEAIDTSTLGPKTFTVTAKDKAGNESRKQVTYEVVDRTAPTIDLTSPPDGAEYILNQAASVLADYACQDEEGGSGLATCDGDLPDGDALNLSSVGPKTFTVKASDQAGNTSEKSHAYRVIYDFAGFFRPVNGLPAVNEIKAGQAVPVKFSLNGDQGLDILADGSPKSQAIPCDSSAPVDGIEETSTAGSSGLQYDPASDQYQYNWKTDRSWAGTCRQLVVRLDDGTSHRATFMLK